MTLIHVNELDEDGYPLFCACCGKRMLRNLDFHKVRLPEDDPSKTEYVCKECYEVFRNEYPSEC